MVLSHDNHMTILYFYLMTHTYLIFPPESLSGVSLTPPFPPESPSGVSPILGLFQV